MVPEQLLEASHLFLIKGTIISIKPKQIWKHLLSEKEIEFHELNENSKHILNNIQLEIDQIPIKEARAQKNIKSKLEEILAEISDKINIEKNEYEQAVQAIDEVLAQQYVYIEMKELKQQLKSDDDELKTIQNRLDYLKEKKEKAHRSLLVIKKT